MPAPGFPSIGLMIDRVWDFVALIRVSLGPGSLRAILQLEIAVFDIHVRGVMLQHKDWSLRVSEWIVALCCRFLGWLFRC